MYESENYLFAGGAQSRAERDRTRSRREGVSITGTVVEATGSKVMIEKETERFEFDIDPATTKGSAEIKVESTVTVTYVMSATKIEAGATSQIPSPQSSP
jgi:hypothetical protein